MLGVGTFNQIDLFFEKQREIKFIKALLQCAINSMQKHRKITLERFEKFISKEFFSDANILSQLYKPGFKVIPEHDGGEGNLKISVFSIDPQATTFPPSYTENNDNSIPVTRLDPIYHNVSFDEMMVLTEKGTKLFKPCRVGDSFGPSWSTHWFRIQGHVPQSWLTPALKQDEKVVLRWLTGAEGLLYAADGTVLQGLVDRREHIELHQDGRPFDLYIEMACNGMFGNGQDGLINPPNERKFFHLNTCELVILQEKVADLFNDFQVIADLARFLPEDSQRGADALYTANQIINVFFPDDPDTWTRAKTIADTFLYGGNKQQQHAIASNHEIVAVAHCHIDTAWLWPYRETRRKCARSWASQMHLMEKYPDTILFVCSQAQQYAWLKEDYPALFDRVKKMVRQSSFYPIGGTWIETDGNIPSGESFIRQFVYGQRFFQQEFGITCKIFWLPDTFGYSSQIPQIIKICGADYFFTQKLSWNNINVFPHSTFYWQGLDGTKVKRLVNRVRMLIQILLPLHNRF